MPCNYPSTISHPKFGTPMQVPCGKCIGCRLERSRQWGVRIMHENKCHEESCFITLTYDDDHLPKNGTLVKEHVQLFIKRLRKSISPVKVSYFHCGEYGETTKRPHYHLILFGYGFPDKKLYRITETGDSLYTSAQLEKLWGHGFAPIGQVTFESACYVARYCVDKLTGDLGEAEYERTGRIPPYATMSTKPAIGKRFYERFKDDIINYDEVIVNGKSCKPPKYYDKLLKAEDELLHLEHSRQRLERAAKSEDFEKPERQAVKEEVLKEKLKVWKKKL